MSSTKKLSAEKYSAWPYFKFNLRHNLQHLALYLVIAVLLMVLPTMMIMDDLSDRIERNYDWDYDYVSVVASDILIPAGLGVLVAGAVALLSGMSTLSYVNSKTSVGCYHSFPLKREVLLGCDALTRLIYFAATMIFGYTVPYLIMLASLPADGVIAGARNYWLLALSSVFVFLIVYSLMLFSAGLTGNAVTRLLMAALIVCLPVALYALIVTLTCMGSPRLYDGYYLNEQLIEKIFVPVRGYYGIYELIEDGSIGKLLTTLIDTAFYTVGAFLMQKYRRSEHSGTSIIWKPVFAIVKLAVVVVCSLFGAWFFTAAMGMNETLSLFFGAVIGGVISFIVVNCILYRSSRAMFRGLKTFGITMAVIFVFIVMVPMNAFGLVGRYYSVSATDSFVIRPIPYGAEVVYDTSDDVAMIHELLNDDRMMFSGDTYPGPPLFNTSVHKAARELDDDYKWMNQGKYSDDYSDVKGVYVDENENYVYTYMVYVVQKPKFGLPLALIVESDANSEFTDVITATEEFADAMNISENIDISDVWEAEVRLDTRSLYCYSGGESHLRTFTYDDGTDHHSFLSSDTMKDYLENILARAAYSSEYRETSPVVGQISIYYGSNEKLLTNAYANRRSINLPVYAGDIELLDAVNYAMTAAQAEVDHVAVDYNPIDSSEEYYRRVLKRTGEAGTILLVDCRTGKYREIDHETLVSLADYTSSFLSGDRYTVGQYEIIGDSRYTVLCGFGKNYDSEIRFRRGTDVDEMLRGILED